MKKGNNLGKFRKVLALALVAAMAFTLVNPLNVEAKKAKKVTLAYTSQWSDLAAVDSVAKTLGTGSYKITLKKQDGECNGYAKFVAPETKTYTITLSGANSTGFVSGKMKHPTIDNYLTYVEFSTKGPRKEELDVSDRKLGNYLKKRKATITLNQGDVLYLEFGFSCARVKKAKLNLTIK